MAEDWRLGRYITVKENLTLTGWIFASIVVHSYTVGGGFGSRRIGMKEAVKSVPFNKEEHQALRWLVENGYLFCYENVCAKCGFSKRYVKNFNMYGVTQKGWEIAHLYVKERHI